MNRLLISLLLAAIGVASDAAIVVERTAIPLRDPARRMYEVGTRLVRLGDGSDLLFFAPSGRDGKPPALHAALFSTRGQAENRGFRLELWIPGEVLEGTHTQLLSADMSPDHRMIVFVGGWAGAGDRRGHNGIFVLRQEEKSRYWRNIAWFDVPGVTLGEVAFGPADTLLVTTHEQRPNGGPAPILTVYSLTGQKLGSFLEDPQHGGAAAARFPRQARIARIDETKYAVLDPESATVRFIQVAMNGTQVSVRETHKVNVPFDLQQCVIAAFDVLPDGRPVVARTSVEDHKGKTSLAIIDPTTGTVEESEMPKTWRFGTVAGGEFHGFSTASDLYEYASEMSGHIR